ncbi:MAG: exo-alpha-sialidase [Actinobacteria bacterium]|nr:exo-alpha-sialidase [Actinomycetota bacterium]
MRRTSTAAAMGAALALAIWPVTAQAATIDVQANNPQVAGVADSNASALFPTNKQNEPTVAVDPTNPSLLIAGSNDEQLQPPCGPGPVRGPNALPTDCSFFPGVGTSGIYLSNDGGKSWTNHGLLDQQASWAGTGVISDGDPVITFGPKPDGKGGFSYAHGSRAYYASLATISSLKGFEQIIVSYSDDDGTTWSAPVLATNRTNAAQFNDKNWVTVDRSPSSPYFGRVYVSWTAFRSATATGYGNEPTMVATSANGGASFGAPNQLSPAGNNGTGNGRQGTSGTVGPDGTAYVAFEQGQSQVVVVSRDGGVSWTRPMTIGPVTDIQDPIPGANFRTDSFPVIAADPRAGSATTYAAWTNRTSTGGITVVAKSTDRGQTWSQPAAVSSSAQGYAFFPGLDVASTGRVDLGWQGLKAVNPLTFGTGNAKIDAYYSSLPAGASSWTAPAKVSSQSSDPAASAQNNLQRQFWGDYNTMVSSADSAWFIYTDSRTGEGCLAVDRYQTYLAENGLAAPDQVDGGKDSGKAPAPAATAVPKPAPRTDCPKQFGNTDVYVSVIGA